MLLVGLTGGIATGKTLVCRVFRERGARIIDADRIVHELLAGDRDIYRQIREHFGEGVLLPDRCIDRKKLGEIVFSDGRQRAWLNALLHPRVFEAFRRQVRRFGETEPDAIVVFEAALLVETGFHARLDRLVVVSAEPEQQLERLMARDGLTREQAASRIASQMPIAEKRAYADYVIDNAGSREDTERQANVVFDRLREEADRLRR